MGWRAWGLSEAMYISAFGTLCKIELSICSSRVLLLLQTHDDSARLLSFTWAAVKTIDKAEAVAKTILLKADCRKRDSIWSWLK